MLARIVSAVFWGRGDGEIDEQRATDVKPESESRTRVPFAVHGTGTVGWRKASRYGERWCVVNLRVLLATIVGGGSTRP